MPPFQVFFVQRAENYPTMTKISRDQDTQYKCVYQNLALYMIFKAMNADKWLWPIFGCKVSQSVPIEMKLQLDV